MAAILISTSILSADFAHLADQIDQAAAAGADWLHIDVMDGHFVPNISMGPFIVETCRRISSLPLDVHLMIEKPERFIKDFAHAGAERLGIHIEGNPNAYRTLQQIRELGCKPTIVINPGTPSTALTEVLSLVDMVLVMTVNPGFSGQQYIPEVEPKISTIRSMLNHLHPDKYIQVDGGINEKTICGAYQAGANCFVAANAVFNNPAGIAEGIRALRKAVQ